MIWTSLYYSFHTAVLWCNKDGNNLCFEKDVGSTPVYTLPESDGFISWRPNTENFSPLRTTREMLLQILKSCWLKVNRPHRIAYLWLIYFEDFSLVVFLLTSVVTFLYFLVCFSRVGFLFGFLKWRNITRKWNWS